MKKFLFIDGYHLVFRAYYAFPPMVRNDDGGPGSVLYGFSSMLLNLLFYQKPDYIAIAFDSGKTFRHELDESYKANRGETPEDIILQVPELFSLIESMGLKIFTKSNFEADDVLGSFATQFGTKHTDSEMLIATGDRDMLQLISDNVFVLLPAKGSAPAVKMDRDLVFEKYGLSPEQIPDLKGLAGDSSDNIKGVLGIGPKTATNLLQRYGSLSGIYENISSIKGAAQKKLIEHEKSAWHSLKMAKIVTDLDMGVSAEDISYSGLADDCYAHFERLGFNNILRRLSVHLAEDSELEYSASEVFGQRPKKKKDDQLSLF